MPWSCLPCIGFLKGECLSNVHGIYMWLKEERLNMHTDFYSFLHSWDSYFLYKMPRHWMVAQTEDATCCWHAVYFLKLCFLYHSLSHLKKHVFSFGSNVLIPESTGAGSRELDLKQEGLVLGCNTSVPSSDFSHCSKNSLPSSQWQHLVIIFICQTALRCSLKMDGFIIHKLNW